MQVERSSVSILVVVDIGLRPVEGYSKTELLSVSILVVVDIGLRPTMLLRALERGPLSVSILVVVDIGLRRE